MFFERLLTNSQMLQKHIKIEIKDIFTSMSGAGQRGQGALREARGPADLLQPHW